MARDKRSPFEVKNQASIIPLVLDLVAKSALVPTLYSPIGMIIMWSGTEDDIPDGWVLCDGSEATKDRSDGKGTINVPNLKGRFILGGNDSGSAGVLGATNSSHDTTLNTAQNGFKTTGTALDITQIPSHTHTISDRYLVNNSTYTFNITSPTAFGFQYADAGETTSATGGGAAHDHDYIPSYYVLAFLMRY